MESAGSCWGFGTYLSSGSGRVVGEFCQSEVEHFHIRIAPHHDILWLDIAMHDTRFVGCGECIGIWLAMPRTSRRSIKWPAICWRKDFPSMYSAAMKLLPS